MPGRRTSGFWYGNRVCRRPVVCLLLSALLGVSTTFVCCGKERGAGGQVLPHEQVARPDFVMSAAQSFQNASQVSNAPGGDRLRVRLEVEDLNRDVALVGTIFERSQDRAKI